MGARGDLALSPHPPISESFQRGDFRETYLSVFIYYIHLRICFRINYYYFITLMANCSKCNRKVTKRNPKQRINRIRPQKMDFVAKSTESDLRKWISMQNQQNRTSENGFRCNIDRIRPQKMDFVANTKLLKY